MFGAAFALSMKSVAHFSWYFYLTTRAGTLNNAQRTCSYPSVPRSRDLNFLEDFMIHQLRRPLALFSMIVFLSMSLSVAHGSGGRIEGKVSDPKGAGIVGAAITVIDPINDQKFTAVTDDQGRYKVEGLTAGVYTVVVSAKGFNDLHRENVKVEEGVATPIDLQLEIAPVEAQVKV